MPVDFPALNATLNGLAAILLSIGYVLIRQQRIEAHRLVMLSAFTVSVLFLISYLVYHYRIHGGKPFPHQGPIRAVYFTILISHTILAAAVPVLAIITLSRALGRRFDKHRKIARWTLPIWLYVSVTGVVVYWMLYRL